ncbi:MAG: transcription antitermination factor NusB [Victivallaceae bacterium]|nr:transcription antitermination factor NusB [Victivallaceae bacterium]
MSDEILHEPNRTTVPVHSKRLGRELAMQFLFRCDVCGETPEMERFDAFYPQAAEVLGLPENRVARKARDYAMRVFTLVAVNRDQIDKTIAARAEHWDLDRLSVVDRNIMRVATAEMLFCDDIPPVVSIDEAVEIARDYSNPAAGNFINGVLNAVKNQLTRSPRGEKETQA